MGTVVLGDHDRELRRPRLATGPRQPGILGANRRSEVVEPAERVEVVKGRRDGELVIAIVAIGHDRAREVEHAET
ncbi:MAG: hypothetical protein ACRDLS_05710 [Solirubrobacteraceae bacterium]